MKIKTELVTPFTIEKEDEFGDRSPIMPIEFVEQELDYDFYTDEVIELERLVSPIDIIPQDGLRYSIINIMAFMLDKMINEAMIRYTKSSNSYNPNKKCMMIMKNEYLFKRLLCTESKKTYASIIELQEGHYMGGVLDIKGLSLSKSTLNESSQEKLQKILAEDILKCSEISQIDILKKIVLLEKEIYNSLLSGNKEYYKPLTIKSMYSYVDPMKQQGIKAAIVWNKLRDSNLEPIDLEKKNYIDVVKIDMNPKNIEILKETYPEKYEAALELLQQKEFSKGIDIIAIPENVETPNWLLEFINYKVIINDNITNFKKPLESIGLQLVGGKVNYTNILGL